MLETASDGSVVRAPRPKIVCVDPIEQELRKMAEDPNTPQHLKLGELKQLVALMGVAGHSEIGKGALASVLSPRVDGLPTDPLLDEFPGPARRARPRAPGRSDGRPRADTRCQNPRYEAVTRGQAQRRLQQSGGALGRPIAP